MPCRAEKIYQKIIEFERGQLMEKCPFQGYQAMDQEAIRTRAEALVLVKGLQSPHFRVRLAIIKRMTCAPEFEDLFVEPLMVALKHKDTATDACKALMVMTPREETLPLWLLYIKAPDPDDSSYPGLSDNLALLAINRLKSGQEFVVDFCLDYLEAVWRGEKWCSIYLLKPIRPSGDSAFNYAYLEFVTELLLPAKIEHAERICDKLLSMFADGCEWSDQDKKVYASLFVRALLTLCAHYGAVQQNMTSQFCDAVKEKWPDRQEAFHELLLRCQSLY